MHPIVVLSIGLFVLWTMMLYVLAFLTLHPTVLTATFMCSAICVIGGVHIGAVLPAMGFLVGNITIIMATPRRRTTS